MSSSERESRVADPDYEVEFREGITTIIPSLIKLLEDDEEHIRRNTFDLLCKLADHGESQVVHIATQLTRTVKLSGTMLS